MCLESILHEAAEVCSPFGGVYLRTSYDEELWDHPIVSAVHADSAIPTFKWGRLVAVTFVRELGRNGNEVTRYLERYELTGTPQSRTVWAFNAVYVGSPDKLGRRVDLGAFDDTRGLSDEADLNMPVMPVAYAPNVRMSREDRGSELGRSDFEGILGLFDNLDETASGLMRDIRLGKGRAFVPEAFLQSLGRGAGAIWDPDNEIYASLDIPPTSPAAEINVQQFAIRVADHVAAMEHWTRAAVNTAGYSGSTFGLDRDGGDMTATEVGDRRSRSNGNRGKKTRYFGYALQEMATAVLWTAKNRFGADVDPAEVPTIDWPAAADPDPLRDAQTLQALRSAGIISRYLGIKAQHPDWDDPDIDEELQRIEAEDALTDPGTFTGGPFGNENTDAESATDEAELQDDEEPADTEEA
jgi:A118 family predicted phage portal protein